MVLYTECPPGYSQGAWELYQKVQRRSQAMLQAQKAQASQARYLGPQTPLLTATQMPASPYSMPSKRKYSSINQTPILQYGIHAKKSRLSLSKPLEQKESHLDYSLPRSDIDALHTIAEIQQKAGINRTSVNWKAGNLRTIETAQSGIADTNRLVIGSQVAPNTVITTKGNFNQLRNTLIARQQDGSNQHGTLRLVQTSENTATIMPVDAPIEEAFGPFQNTAVTSNNQVSNFTGETPSRFVPNHASVNNYVRQPTAYYQTQTQLNGSSSNRTPSQITKRSSGFKNATYSTPTKFTLNKPTANPNHGVTRPHHVLSKPPVFNGINKASIKDLATRQALNKKILSNALINARLQVDETTADAIITSMGYPAVKKSAPVVNGNTQENPVVIEDDLLDFGDFAFSFPSAPVANGNINFNNKIYASASTSTIKSKYPRKDKFAYKIATSMGIYQGQMSPASSQPVDAKTNCNTANTVDPVTQSPVDSIHNQHSSVVQNNKDDIDSVAQHSASVPTFTNDTNGLPITTDAPLSQVQASPVHISPIASQIVNSHDIFRVAHPEINATTDHAADPAIDKISDTTPKIKACSTLDEGTAKDSSAEQVTTPTLPGPYQYVSVLAAQADNYDTSTPPSLTDLQQIVDFNNDYNIDTTKPITPEHSTVPSATTGTTTTSASTSTAGSDFDLALASTSAPEYDLNEPLPMYTDLSFLVSPKVTTSPTPRNNSNTMIPVSCFDEIMDAHPELFKFDDDELDF